MNTIFGFPGGSVLDIYDALYYEKNINHIAGFSATDNNNWAGSQEPIR